MMSARERALYGTRGPPTALPLPPAPVSESHTGGYALLVGLAEALALLGCFLPWYALGLVVGDFQLPAVYKPTSHLLAAGYGGWRVALPVAAGVTLALAVVTVGRVGARAGVSIYAWALRLGALATFGLVLAAMLERVPSLGLPAQDLARVQMLGLHFDLSWGAWITAVAAFGAAALSVGVRPDR